MRGVASDELTPNERIFVDEYAVDRNGTQAYLKAFPKSTYATANVESHRLLRKPSVKAEVKAALRAHARRCRIDAQRVLRELAAIAFADVGEAFEDGTHGGLPSPRPLGKMPKATRRAIQSVKVKRRVISSSNDEDYEVQEIEYKFADKLSALDKLCKHLGLTSDGEALKELLKMLAENGGKK